jgi:hypothetical protein
VRGRLRDRLAEERLEMDAEKFSEKTTDYKRRQLREDCQGLASRAWLFKEARQVIRHGWNKQAPIQEQVPHFAACFSNK